MAEILVKAMNGPNNLGAYQMGDAVVIKEDGHVWGSEEGLPKFWIIKVPGVNPGVLSQLLDGSPLISRPDHPELLYRVRRRIKTIDPSTIPTVARNKLTSTGTITVTKAQVDSFTANRT